MCDNFQNVLAFEPVADFRLCLERNVPAKNLFISPLALGAENTMINMIVTQHNTGHSHVDTNSIGQGSIQMLTLDTFMETYKFGTVDYIKIDCEGFENNIVAGAKQTILRDRPIMVVEDKKHKDVGHSDIEAVPTLLSWGARILKTVNNDVIIGW
jgi:FkbM family methyltransferase